MKTKQLNQFIQHAEPECESYPLIQKENVNPISILLIIAGLVLSIFSAMAATDAKQDSTSLKGLQIIRFDIGAAHADTVRILKVNMNSMKNFKDNEK